MTEQTSSSNPTCDDDFSTNPVDPNPPLPDFITALNVQQQNVVKTVWNSDTLTLSEKIACIDELSGNMAKETRREYRRWRFQHDKSSANEFIEKQNPTMQDHIRLCLSSKSNLDEFYNSMLVLLPSFDDKEVFINWAKSEMLQCSSAFMNDTNKILNSHVDKITPGKELNILLLGETDVGKSTFINSFANYVTYNTLKEAEQGKQIYLVPSQFTITDGEYKEKTITVGKSDNESFIVGESSTQEPRSYVFNAGNRTIRLIDTPGIGDTRGAHMDDRNFAAILQYISHIKEIHGICILLKPNNAHLNIVFKYCVNELLTHLHVSAAVNITFCFTNARSTFYRPGDTLLALNKFLDDLKAQRNVDITTNKSTIYCMDNESFRFLCCVQQGEKFTDEEYKNFEQSWTHSVQETNRLLDHFEKDVPPHSVGRTVSFNEARSLILTLAKPLADVSQNIQDNIQVISEETTKVERLDLRSAELEKPLVIPGQMTPQIRLDTKSSREKQEILIKSLNDRVDKYKAEQARIDKICAKFGAFLKANAIVPYNDAIEDYLQFNIREIDRQPRATNNPDLLQKSQRLKDQLKQYQEAKRVLDQMMVTGKEKPVEPSEIKKMQQELESLELTGKDIKKLFDATLNGTKTNFNYSEKYFDSSQYNRPRQRKSYAPRLPPITDRQIYTNQSHMYTHDQPFGGNFFPSSHNAHNGFYDYPYQQQQPYSNAANYQGNSRERQPERKGFFKSWLDSLNS